MPPVGFEPTVSAGERTQTYALDRAATGTDKSKFSTNVSILVMVVVPSLVAVPEVSKSLITNPLLIRPLSQFCALSILSTHCLFLAFSFMLSDIFLLSTSWTNSTNILYTILRWTQRTQKTSNILTHKPRTPNPIKYHRQHNLLSRPPNYPHPPP